MARVSFGVTVLILFFCSALTAQEKIVNITGRLSRAVAIGGESTGWSLHSDSEITVNGRPVHQIEVESEDSRQLEQFSGKRVRVSGRVQQRHGIETGPRSILAVSSIEELHDGDAASPNELAGSDWKLTDLPGSRGISGGGPTLSFSDAGRVSGNGSCNRFSGAVEMNGNTIQFGPLATTRMACSEPAMEQETRYLKMLQSAEHFAIINSTLALRCRGFAKPLLFTRSKAAARN